MPSEKSRRTRAIGCHPKENRKPFRQTKQCRSFRCPAKPNCENRSRRESLPPWKGTSCPGASRGFPSETLADHPTWRPSVPTPASIPNPNSRYFSRRQHQQCKGRETESHESFLSSLWLGCCHCPGPTRGVQWLIYQSATGLADTYHTVVLVAEAGRAPLDCLEVTTQR